MAYRLKLTLYAMIGNVFVDLGSGLLLYRRRQDCRKLIDIKMSGEMQQYAQLSRLNHWLVHSNRQRSAWSFRNLFSWWSLSDKIIFSISESMPYMTTSAEL